MQTPASSSPSSPSSPSDLSSSTNPQVSVVDAGRDAESKAFALGLAHDQFFTLYRPLIPDQTSVSEEKTTTMPTKSELDFLSPAKTQRSSSNSQMLASQFLKDLASRVSSIPPPPSSPSAPEIQATSVLRKRKLKMNKHKYKKLRKRTRALRRKLGK
ncbi:hypothetical protein BJ684DRAFT_21644 [Piptocephalis cylindrospora]|uniref:Small ribosomal subunit protein mS38 n=1 Tax=Piptocephalis cylindrospora TaxID=1907219 RepID=A0A4V1IXP5_9FUNG|nr:hypothetical protein BJ684DRAFT_21644 [Piptocephalis cylindrospora]|eukprot:RKP11779.1 hypothetical protein BJ684DRAFT_21644 [Piptocephalis cylindrospora]